MIRLTVLAAVALSLVVLAGPAGAASHPQLVGVVGQNDAFKITLSSGGKIAKTLKAGTYTIKVEDKASIHNFHLKGPGVNKSTGVSFTGEQTWKVKLKKGTYTYQCDPHASAGMKGTFKVTG